MRMKAAACAVLLLPVALGLGAQGGSSSCGGNGASKAGVNAAAGNVAARGGEADVAEQGGAKELETGTWGGHGVRLEVGEKGDALIEFDCAHGSIEKLAPDAEGNFAARGLFVKERGGPVRAGREPEGEPARYGGKVAGKTMTLRVVLEGSGEEVGTYTLTHGRGTRLTKCL